MRSRSASWTLTYYLRTNTASEGATVVGSAYGTGWEFTIAAATSAAFDAGDWYWQALATYGTEKVTLGAGQLEVLAALSYSGAPGAVDGRSQAQKDLDAVQAAIRAIVSGGVVKQYTIGNRSLSKYDLADLLQLEGKLKADVKREQMAELIANGLGNPAQSVREVLMGLTHAAVQGNGIRADATAAACVSRREG
jgi:hypothetical protein